MNFQADKQYFCEDDADLPLSFPKTINYDLLTIKDP